MSTVMIIGAGGVGNVVAHKCAMNPETFSKVIIASRTLEKCQAIQKMIGKNHVIAEQVDADHTEQLVQLIQKYQPHILIHVALPYQNLSIMDACIQTKTPYIDTANYEHPDDPRFSYKKQWAYHETFIKNQLLGVLGAGFDPGVTNIFCAYAQKHLFDEIHTIDILDCNGGDHGYPFATNFNPEINIREVTAPGKFWEKGQWMVCDPMSVHHTFDYPEVGPKKSFLMYHEEQESLVLNIKGLQRIRFWMTFSDRYIQHIQVLQNVGMTGIEPIDYEGQQIVPLQFLKAVLPNPGDLGERTKGKTCIGCLIEGIKDGQKIKKFIFNVCDHEEAYLEVKSQAISYTTGVPAMIAGMLVSKGIWKEEGIYNIETLDPDPFMDALNKWGLPWQIIDMDQELDITDSNHSIKVFGSELY